MSKIKLFKDKKTFVRSTDKTPRPVYEKTSSWNSSSKDTGKKQYKDGSIRKPKKSWW